MSSRIIKNRSNNRIENVIDLITDLKMEETLSELQQLLDDGTDPKLLLDTTMEGMRRVGVLFEKGTYYIAALVMAGEIMRAVNQLLLPYLTAKRPTESSGRMLIGTIKGDIHDLGKDLFSLLLQCHGIEVVDLGVDVPAETFLERAKQEKPNIIGISCVLTSCIEALKQSIGFLQERLSSPPPSIIVGGTCLDKLVADHVGAKYWAGDAATGLKICQLLLSKTSPTRK